MSGLRVSNCRSCDDPIIWCTTAKDKKMPLDADPVEHGKFAILDAEGATDDGSPLAVWFTKTDGREPLTDGLHVSHFTTCPQADSHRRGS